MISIASTVSAAKGIAAEIGRMPISARGVGMGMRAVFAAVRPGPDPNAAVVLAKGVAPPSPPRHIYPADQNRNKQQYRCENHVLQCVSFQKAGS
ncbi:hypothetical protein [Ruegeria sp. PrR005]|uniref:Uncharacterized protein n=1 Tax=Ruegeria sp. PrR005 TaxID=2706882 RepID=A0A6B2NWA6_9RHOB|nr:hypothetical protein [Ruegeria sp. PrR005]NDW47738.1 hypothetical protein [Ruegeria sp. PrR005]